MLRQALTNLLQNAADAVGMRGDPADSGRLAAGMIAVAVEQRAHEVRITVTDNGIGLPDNRSQLMEPYVTHKPKGTGLGLAIVKKIMEDHGGKIVLDDRADGPGTVASLILPARPATVMAESAPAAVPARVSNGA
jgi:two-component system nitrogen regulation sensor histidine kinase NtrY